MSLFSRRLALRQYRSDKAALFADERLNGQSTTATVGTGPDDLGALTKVAVAAERADGWGAVIAIAAAIDFRYY